MRLLLTSATSEFGRTVADLLSGDHEMVLTDQTRHAEGHPDVVACDLGDDDSTDRLVAGIDAIVHIGHGGHFSSASDLLDVNTRCTYNLLTAVRDAPRSATYAVVYLGLSPSIAGYALFTYGLSRLPASRVSVFIYLIPVCALAIAWVWLGEVPGWLTVAGGAVSVAGVVVVNVWGAPGSVAADG